MTKPLFAVLALTLAVPAFASATDDAFNAVVRDINDAVRKITAAQARQSREVRPELMRAPAAPQCTPAQADEAYTALRRCEDGLKAANGGVGLFDIQGAPAKGFAAGRWMGGYPSGVGLVLLTTTDAYVYHEDCDICAAITKCSLKDGKITTFATAHSVGCGALSPVIRAKGAVVVYSDCPLP